MLKYSRVCLFSFLSAISLSLLRPPVAAVGSGTQVGKPQLEIQVEQFKPDMSGENKFIQESQDRFHRLDQENQIMIEEDKQMMRDEYDPNEKYFQPQSHKFQL